MTDDPAARSAFQQLLEDLRTNVKLADQALAALLDDTRTGREGVVEDVGETLRQLRADISQVLAEPDATTTDERAAYFPRPGGCWTSCGSAGALGR